MASFGLDLSDRQTSAVHASELLYRRIQDLESTLVEKNVELEQGKQREMQLHQTLAGFKELSSAQEKTIAELRLRLEEHQRADQETRTRQILLQHDSFQLSREVQRLRGVLADPPASSSPMRRSGAAGHSPSGSANASTSSPAGGMGPLRWSSSSANDSFAGTTTHNNNSGAAVAPLNTEESYVRRINRLETQLEHASREAADAVTLLNHLIPAFQFQAAASSATAASSPLTFHSPSSPARQVGRPAVPLNSYQSSTASTATTDLARLIADYVATRRKQETLLLLGGGGGNSTNGGGNTFVGDSRLMSSPAFLTPTRSR